MWSAGSRPAYVVGRPAERGPAVHGAVCALQSMAPWLPHGDTGIILND
jgi:hypothetical protein